MSLSKVVVHVVTFQSYYSVLVIVLFLDIFKLVLHQIVEIFCRVSCCSCYLSKFLWGGKVLAFFVGKNTLPFPPYF